MCFSHYKPGAQKPTPGIYIMDADGSDPTLLAKDELGAGGMCDWSPDGTKIAFHAFSDAIGDHYQKAVDKALTEGDLQKAQEKLDKLRGERNNQEVYVINADGSGQTALTSNLAADIYPRWSPDGTKITFVSDRDGDFDIYTMEADGSDVAQVTKNSRNDEASPDWQPLSGPTEAKPERQQQQTQRDSKSRSVTVHPPDTGGPSLLLVASTLLFSGGVIIYTGVKRKT